jgi:TonB family protein
VTLPHYAPELASFFTPDFTSQSRFLDLSDTLCSATSMVTPRTIGLPVIGIICLVSVLNAQHVRMGNEGLVIENGGITPPTILKSTLGSYTDEARLRGIEGTVTIAAQVDVNGEIKVLRVLKGLGFGLDEVAASTVNGWTMSPATRVGIPVLVMCQIDVEFSLRSANALHMMPGMDKPTVLQRVPPQYTEEARRAGLNGTVVLQAVIKTDGTVDVLRVVRGLPLGLTENAINALKQWQFSPGKKNGQDVDASVNLEVNFNLRK